MSYFRQLRHGPQRPIIRIFSSLIAVALIGSFFPRAQAQADEGEFSFILQAGDRIGVSFPGAPDLDRDMQIRRDGIASFPLVGEVRAAGKSPGQLEEILMEHYKDQLVTNEVMVAVLDSKFEYYVEGEVSDPGKVESFRALTALEAILEAGGYTEIAKINQVKVIRRKGDKYEFHEVDLKRVLDGKSDESFSLEPNDIISVPAKIW